MCMPKNDTFCIIGEMSESPGGNILRYSSHAESLYKSRPGWCMHACVRAQDDCHFHND